MRYRDGLPVIECVGGTLVSTFSFCYQGRPASQILTFEVVRGRKEPERYKWQFIDGRRRKPRARRVEDFQMGSILCQISLQA